MSANAVKITVDDKTKTMRFDEALTSGSNYAVKVTGGRSVAGARSTLVLLDEYGLQLAGCELANGEGTLSTDTEEMKKRVVGTPTGTVASFVAYIRDISTGQNVATGIAMVVCVDHWTGGEAAAKRISYLGRPGQRGESAYEIAVRHGYQGTEQEWLASLGSVGKPRHTAYAYDPVDKKLLPIVVYTNDAGEKVPTVDTDAPEETPPATTEMVVAEGTGTSGVARSLAERFGEVANVLDFGAVAEGDLYRQEDGNFKSLDDYCKEVGPYSDQQWEDMTDAQRKDVRDSVYPSLPAHHDDTAAIQKAINHVAAQGGGVVFFPYPGDKRRYYRIAGEPYAWYDPEAGCGVNLVKDPGEEDYLYEHASDGATVRTDKPYWNGGSDAATDRRYRKDGDPSDETDCPYYNTETAKHTWMRYRKDGTPSDETNFAYYNPKTGRHTANRYRYLGVLADGVYRAVVNSDTEESKKCVAEGDLPYYNPVKNAPTQYAYRGAGSGNNVTDPSSPLDLIVPNLGGTLNTENLPNGRNIANDENTKLHPAWQPLKAQIIIPPNSNVSLVGEDAPPMSLQRYYVPKAENGGMGFRDYGRTFACYTSVLRSTRDVDERVGYLERPWSVIAAPEGERNYGLRVPYSSESFSMRNLEIRAHIEVIKADDKPRLYPTMGAVNLMNVRRMHIENCFLGLDNEIGSSGSTGRCLQKSPTTTVGLFGTVEDCAEQQIVQLTVQGFKFGVVIPEMTNANFIHVSNCEYALSFLDATHLTVIDHLSTHNNRRCICALPIPRPLWVYDEDQTPKWRTEVYPHPFGCPIHYTEWDATEASKRNQAYKSQVNIRILAHDYENGHTEKPFVSQMRWGIWDPQDRMVGTVVYHQGYPGDRNSGQLKVAATTGDTDRINAIQYNADHCFYDHRSGGENASPFGSAVNTESGIEADVKDWMANDWALEGYDFVVWGSGDNVGICQDENTGRYERMAASESTATGDALIDGGKIIDTDHFYRSAALPPCPMPWNADHQARVRYAPPDYGSYYPILGATHVIASELSNLDPMKALMPRFDSNVATTFGTTLYNRAFCTLANDNVTVVSREYRLLIRRSGWLVFSGKLASGMTLNAIVHQYGYEYFDNGTKKLAKGAIIYSSSATGGTSGDTVGLTVPCPAGSCLVMKLAGLDFPEDNDRRIRFYPCPADACAWNDRNVEILDPATYTSGS